MAKKKIYSDLGRLDRMTDADIQAGIDADPDAAPDLTTLNLKRVRGPQRAPTKARHTLYLSREVVQHFKGIEPKGWQTRLSDHLIKSIKPGRMFSTEKTHGRSTRSHTTIKEQNMPSKDQIDKVWKNAKPVRGKDPSKIRQDPYGNKISRASYGKDSDTGWEVDHIKPVARGGSDATQNLQALKTEVNREKGDSLVKKSRHNQ